MASVIKLSYHRRLFLVLLAFSWLMTCLVAAFQYVREREYKSDFISAQLQLYNRYLLESVEQGEDYQRYIATHSRPFEDLRVSVITLSGTVVYDNELDSDSLDNHRGRPEVAEALKKGAGYHIGRRSASDGHQYFYSATRGERVVVRTAIPYSASLRELLRADWAFLWGMIVLSSVMSVVAYFVTRRLGKTIDRLNLFAKRAKRGEAFDEDEPFPNDELGAISNSIIQLYGQWQQTILDRDRAHEAAMREEQEKIRIKRQLTNNINHELKTPVASMQVCLETLLSGISLTEEKRQELIERCYANAERLRRLLGDVSLITRMEDGSALIAKQPVCLNDIINEVAAEVAIMPADERMEVHIEVKERVEVEGNLMLISSIFQNLTENALDYSGGKNIYITLLENTAEVCRLRFEDDGRGVASAELPRLFERFYRVDKGRSRR
ncbi:MAG: HAMP domain-containing sensor histidine kinase, partial [Prevotellamassilia sp.]|nr:HAMP domain-containing sensor histidine kinase [Prevotellamassilia sp.]